MIKKPVKIIAEVGVNHNNDLNVARQLIDVAWESGADIVKFQLFSAEKIATEVAPRAQYQKTGDSGDQKSLLRGLELTEDDYLALLDHAERRGVECIATAFDLDKIDFLQAQDQGFFKIPSGEITNLPYLRHVASFGKPVFLSTGMSTLEEIGVALDLLHEAGLERSDITVLHCTSAYPAPYRDLNLPAMLSIRDEFQVRIGYSDHSVGIAVAVGAAALGAEVIEKHITLDRAMIGPDHQASIEPDELRELVHSIRCIEQAIQSNQKEVSASELENRDVVRRSIVARTAIRKGEILSIENLDTKRPGNGISPMRWQEVIGTRAKREFRPDELIEL